MVTDVIGMNRLPKSQAILVNTAWYDPAELARWVRQNPVVPHTRRRLSSSEVANIVRRAAGRSGAGSTNASAPAARRRPAQRPRAPASTWNPPGILAYFRRHTRRRQAPYAYYAATSSTRAYRYTPAGNWVPLRPGRIDEAVLLILSRSRVDVSLDFGPNGQGHWEQMRLGDVTSFSFSLPDTTFFQALRSILPADRAALWQAYA